MSALAWSRFFVSSGLLAACVMLSGPLLVYILNQGFGGLFSGHVHRVVIKGVANNVTH